MNLPDRLCPWLFDALESLERAARASRLGHGWLISGPQDVGKRNLAYVLAGRMLRGQTGEAPPEEASPAEITATAAALAEPGDLHPDLFRVRPEEDKRTIAVEQVREMTNALALTPHLAGLKIVIMEQAESMTTAAANALLKSLEEPTPNTWLFLLAERPGRLPATIRSRCQQLPIAAPGAAAAKEWLEAGGIATGAVPPRLLERAPLAIAREAEDGEYLTNYNKIQDTLKLIYEGKGDPHTAAAKWHKADPGLALTGIVDSLQALIRLRLVPERSNPVTDLGGGFPDNASRAVPTRALFEGLEMAENLREQLGRGINVELALKALLLGLEPTGQGRVNT